MKVLPYRGCLYMVSELERDGVRVKVILFFKIRLSILPDIMVYQGDRHDERYMAFSILVDDFKHLLLFIGCENRRDFP